MTDQQSVAGLITTSRPTRVAAALLYTGVVAVILGGLVAAVTSPLSLEYGSWAAAYLVLVAGVAQSSMGIARTLWPRTSGDSGGGGDTQNRGGWSQYALWNLGNVGVIAGTIEGSPPFVFISSALLVTALTLAFIATLRTNAVSRRGLLLLYRVFLVALAVSIPIGMVLSSLRNA